MNVVVTEGEKRVSKTGKMLLEVYHEDQIMDDIASLDPGNEDDDK
jgi:hypothetical protein